MENDSSLHKRQLNYSSDHGFAWESHNHGQKEIYQSTDQVFTNRQQAKIGQVANYVYGQTIDWYLAKIWRSTLGWFVVLIIFQLWLKYYPVSKVLFWLIFGILFVVFCLSIVLNSQKERATAKQAFFAGMLFGFSTGVFISLYDLFTAWQTGYLIKILFNLVLYTLVGGAVTYIIYKSRRRRTME